MDVETENQKGNLPTNLKIVVETAKGVCLSSVCLSFSLLPSFLPSPSLLPAEITFLLAEHHRLGETWQLPGLTCVRTLTLLPEQWLVVFFCPFQCTFLAKTEPATSPHQADNWHAHVVCVWRMRTPVLLSRPCIIPHSVVLRATSKSSSYQREVWGLGSCVPDVVMLVYNSSTWEV